MGVTGLRSNLDIIRQILTNRLQPQDIRAILASLQLQPRDQYLGSVSDILGNVAELLQVSSRLLDNLLMLLVDIATDAVQADRGTLFLADYENKELFSRVLQGGEIQEIRFPLDQGIAGAVIKSREAMIIKDAYADPRFNKEIDLRTGYKTRNLLALPIQHPGGGPQTIGVLELLNWKRDDISESDFDLLKRICSQASQALESALNHEKAQQARESESHLLEVSAAISSELKLKPLLEKIMEAITMILGCDRSTLFLHDEKSNELWSQVAQGLQSGEIRFPANLGIAGKVFTNRETINIPDAYADSRFNKEIDKKTGYRTRNILTMPVINREGKAIGVSQVLNKRDGAFNRGDEKKLRSFSSQASIAIENAKLFDEVLKMKNYNESILESLSNGVISLNHIRRIEKCNAAALKIFEAEGPQMIGKFADIFFTGENHWIVDSLRRVIATNEPDTFIDAEVVSSSGKKISMNMVIAPLRDAEQKPMGGLLVFEDLTGEKRLKGTLSRYMTKEVADQLMNSEGLLGGQMQELTVLFADIRNFTNFSERLGPAETVAMLNEYFTTMVDIIFQQGGILDKFIGDAMLGVFGAPFSTGEDPDRAVTAAIEMLRALEKFNSQRIEKKQEPIAIGVGINSDVVLVGNIGSPKRMDYTVIGDGVNLASRLESANKFYGTSLLVSSNTFKKLKYRYVAREADLLRVKGKDRPIAIYEIVGRKGDDPHDAEKPFALFHEGLQLYRRRQWTEASSRFQDAANAMPGDTLSRVYLERCRHFLLTPPPASWDGVWTMHEK